MTNLDHNLKNLNKKVTWNKARYIEVKTKLDDLKKKLKQYQQND